MKKPTLKKIIAEQIAQEKEYIAEHNQIKDILRTVDGQVFTHKVLNKKLLNDFEFVSQYGMYYIKGKYDHLAGYNSNPYIDAEKFTEFDACHSTAAAERIKQLECLNVEQVFQLFNEIDKAYNKIKLLFGTLETEKLTSFYNPVFYNLLREIQTGEEKDSRILSDLYTNRKYK